MNATGLDVLASRAQYELQCLGYPARTWVPPSQYQGEHVHDAVIVGGGQSGVSVAFGLMRERVTDFIILDRNPPGHEGPWTTFARMQTLRTPKTVTGPDLGIPSLSARAWYEAKFGATAWEKLDKIPRTVWQDYLVWLREIVGIAVRSGTEVFDIEPVTTDILAVHSRDVADGTAHAPLLTRNVVLATGLEGTGRWQIPDMISQALPEDRFAHTADAMDFSRLAGKRVIVLGAGASAFDNAAVALEHDAASVDLLVRRPQIPLVNPNRWMEFAGFLRHFGDLDDNLKWRFMQRLFEINQPPPQDTFDRCARYDNFNIHLSSPIKAVAFDQHEIVVTTPAGTLRADFLVVGTGIAIDFHARPELARFAKDIARWCDRYTPPPDDADANLGGYPYLSGSFQFMERRPGAAAYLRHIRSYTFASMPSLAGSAGISGLKFAIARIVNGVTRDLFLADAESHLASLYAYDDKELVHANLPARQARTAEVA